MSQYLAKSALDADFDPSDLATSAKLHAELNLVAPQPMDTVMLKVVEELLPDMSDEDIWKTIEKVKISGYPPDYSMCPQWLHEVLDRQLA